MNLYNGTKQPFLWRLLTHCNKTEITTELIKFILNNMNTSCLYYIYKSKTTLFSHFIKCCVKSRIDDEKFEEILSLIAVKFTIEHIDKDKSWKDSIFERKKFNYECIATRIINNLKQINFHNFVESSSIANINEFKVHNPNSKLIEKVQDIPKIIIDGDDPEDKATLNDFPEMIYINKEAEIISLIISDSQSSQPSLKNSPVEENINIQSNFNTILPSDVSTISDQIEITGSIGSYTISNFSKCNELVQNCSKTQNFNHFVADGTNYYYSSDDKHHPEPKPEKCNDNKFEIQINDNIWLDNFNEFMNGDLNIADEQSINFFDNDWTDI
jgi:hypothetical protein